MGLGTYDFALAIGGEAGQGIATPGDILARIIVRRGLHLVTYNAYQSIVRGGHIFLTLVIGMWVFHTGNGIRLMIAQAGVGFGKPRRPDYPYTPSSLNMKNKLCIYVSIGLAALAMMYGLGVMYDV